jgi:hypothetical protein
MRTTASVVAFYYRQMTTFHPLHKSAECADYPVEERLRFVKYCAKVDQGIGELWCKSAPP